MFFNGDYFDILLFCVIGALFSLIIIKRRTLFLKTCGKVCKSAKTLFALLGSRIKNRKFSAICLDLAIQILAALFICHHEPPGNSMGIYSLFLFAFIRVFSIYLILLLFSNIYFSLISSFFDIKVFGKRVLTLATLIIIVILERHEVNSLLTVIIFTNMIFLFYCINMAALFMAVGAAREKTMNVRAVWSSAAGILGMFIVLFSVLYYVIGASFPDAFNRNISLLDAVYFTLITFATIGFGDIVATNDFTKAVTIVNALTSIVCLVFLVNAIMGYTSGNDDGIGNNENKE